VCVVVAVFVVVAAVLAVEWNVGIMEISMFYFLDILESEKQNCIQKNPTILHFHVRTYVRTQATGTHSSIHPRRTANPKSKIQDPSASYNSLSVVRTDVQAQYP
jgi:hypothetical protein